MYLPPTTPFMRIDIKTTIIILLAVALILSNWIKGCQVNNLRAKLEQCKSNDQQGKVERDTIYVPQFATFAEHAPVPQKIEFPKLSIKRIFDTLYIEGETVVDTVYIDTLVNRYYTTNYYSKKYNHKYGTITTFDTVSKNNLTGNSINLDLSIPTITNTVYRTRQKAQLYLGIDAFSDNQFNLNGAGANILYVSPRSLAYQIGSYFTDKSSVNFRASIMFPITKK